MKHCPDFMMTEEVWKDVPEYEGLYMVSSQGRVKSLPRLSDRVYSRTGKSYPQPVAEKILSPAKSKLGYFSVHLRRGGKTRTVFVHWLVAEAFLGPRPKEQVIRHLDGNGTNNKVENLAYGTESQNHRDEYDYRGYHWKLTVDDVKNIRNRYEKGEPGTSIMKDYGISKTHVYDIIRGRSYAWLT